MGMTLAPLATAKSKRPGGFTLIELLVVISIIAVLIGLAFPAFQGVQNAARRTQAKNDLVQIVTAVSAFYTEYGRYPTTKVTDEEATFGTAGNSNALLFDELRGVSATTLNPRQIAFINPPDAKDQTSPRNGIKTSERQWYDPWGKPYVVRLDANYDNQVPNPYTPDTGAGSANIRQGVIAYSLGKDLDGGSGSKNSGKGKDDVISWQ
jgi:prepilin-type N-terminal cleavage/methylation domain-containing protein